MPDVIIPAATYAELAAERRAIVLREDANWDRHGFTATEAAAWIANGIPAHHAPLAAVARDVTHFAAATPVPELLKRNISGRSILEMLLDGMDSASIERQITNATGGSIDGDNTTVWRRAPLGGPSRLRIKPQAATRLRGTDTHPSRVPEVVDSLDAWFQANVSTFYGNSVVATDALDYLNYDQPVSKLPKLASYIAAHGIDPADDETIRRLLAATPMSQGIIDMVIAGAAIFTNQVDRALFHLDADEHRALRESADGYRGGSALNGSRLPAPNGFVFLAGDTETGLPATILGWTSTLNGVSFTTGHVTLAAALAAAMRGDVVPVEEAHVAQIEAGAVEWQPENEWAADAFATLVAFADHMEARGLADASSEPRD